MQQNNQTDEPAYGWLTFVAGIILIILEIALAWISLWGRNMPGVVTYGGTAVIAVLLGGSYLYVFGRRFAGQRKPPTEKSTLMRVAEVVIAVVVLVPLTVIAAICGLLLTVLANIGGPDPKTADGDLLRDRLLTWIDRNQAFMRNNGEGELPLRL